MKPELENAYHMINDAWAMLQDASTSLNGNVHWELDNNIKKELASAVDQIDSASEATRQAMLIVERYVLHIPPPAVQHDVDEYIEI